MKTFHPHAPNIKHAQDDKNTCCFSSLVSSQFDARELVSGQAILLCIKHLCHVYQRVIKIELTFQMI